MDAFLNALVLNSPLVAALVGLALDWWLLRKASGPYRAHILTAVRLKLIGLVLACVMPATLALVDAIERSNPGVDGLVLSPITLGLLVFGEVAQVAAVAIVVWSFALDLWNWVRQRRDSESANAA